MCGRFSLTAAPEDVQELFGLLELGDFPPRYNIAPTQPILIVAAGEKNEPGSNLPERRTILVKWGLLPSWVKDPKDFPLLINARSETAATKNSFRAAMRHRRALVPASGFYEWKREGKQKAQPYWVRPKGGGICAFAGLMETWTGPNGEEVDTGAILTTSANRLVAPIHDRMPVVIMPEDFSRWLDCKTQEPRDVADLLVPAPEDYFEAIPVSTKVNKVANSGPDVQQRVEIEDEKPTPKKDDPPPEKGGGGQMSLL